MKQSNLKYDRRHTHTQAPDGELDSLQSPIFQGRVKSSDHYNEEKVQYIVIVCQ